MFNHLDQIKWNEDADNGTDLMAACMNAEALQETVNTQNAVYYSRFGQKSCCKDEEPVRQQLIKQVRLDCDADVFLLKIELNGGITCHVGREYCSYGVYVNDQWLNVNPV